MRSDLHEGLSLIPFESLDNLALKWKGVTEYSQEQWEKSEVLGVVNGSQSGGLITIDVDSKKDITGRPFS